MSECLDNIKVGDNVYRECYTSMGASSNGDSEVTAIITKYDEDTGEPYKVICCGDHWFDGRTGDAMNEPTMFYIKVT